MICAGVKGWTPEVDAIEDCKESRRRGGEVDRDATELYIAVASPRGLVRKLQLADNDQIR